MQVEIWSDVLCPWCGIGARRLTEALRLDGREVDLVHRSYQLDPAAPRGVTTTVADALSIKYGAGPADVATMTRRVEAIAAADGLSPYLVGENLSGSTEGVHELLALAAYRGLAEVAWDRAYRAYFGRTGDIFTEEGLVALGVEIGLAAGDVRAVLADGRYAAHVAADQQRADELGVTGVPFVLVDGRYAVPGAQSVEVLTRVLDKAWGTRIPAVVAAGDGCGPDGCAVPDSEERS
jgi:predicted DsbA family dithiol-disulfide isomerase